MVAHMGISVAWDNDDKTAIRYDFVGQWDWKDFQTVTTEGFALTKSVEQRVDNISNFYPGAKMPSDAMFHFSRAMKYAPDNRGVTVIVGGSMLTRNLVTIFSKVYKPLGQRLFL